MDSFPKLEHFLFCRSARADPDGTIEIAELLVGPLFVHGPCHLDQLTIFVALSDMSQINQFKPRVTIVEPNGKARRTDGDWKDHPPANECHIYALVIGGFEIAEEGRYVVRLDLEFDGELRTGYSRPLEIRFDGATPSSLAGVR